jgi:hypothetical protein
MISEATIITLIIAVVIVIALFLFDKVKVLIQVKSIVVSLVAKDSKREGPRRSRSARKFE